MVVAARHGGQVLLDGTTAGLCSTIDLIALGPRRLRDMAKPVERQLGANYPVIQALSNFTNNDGAARVYHIPAFSADRASCSHRELTITQRLCGPTSFVTSSKATVEGLLALGHKGTSAMTEGYRSRIDQKGWTFMVRTPHRERENHWETDEYWFDR